jgi:hypothetical protein
MILRRLIRWFNSRPLAPLPSFDYEARLIELRQELRAAHRRGDVDAVKRLTRQIFLVWGD